MATQKNTLSQITKPTCLVYRAARNTLDWVTVRSISEKAGLNARTVRGVLSALTDEGLLEKYPCHGGFRYRMRDATSSSAKALAQRIHDAEKVFGLTPEKH